MTSPSNERWWSKALGVALIVALGLFMLWGFATSLGLELH